MTQVAYLSLALFIGLGSALQVSLLAQLGRERGSFEATLINVMPTLIGVSLLFGYRIIADDPPAFAAPLNSVALYAVMLAAATALLVFSMRGLGAHLALTGIFGFAYVAAAAFLAPKLGLALYSSAVTAGTLGGVVALDHIGAFGAQVHHVTPVRLAGLLALLLGVALIRSGR